MIRRILVFSFLAGIILGIPFLGCDSPGSTPRGFAKFAILTLSVHPSTPAAANAPPTAMDQPVLLFTVTGDPYQETDLKGISVTLTGSGTEASVAQAYLFNDDDASSVGTFDPGNDSQVGNTTFSGGRADFNIIPSLTIPAGGAVSLFVVYDFNGATLPGGGETYGASIAAPTDVTATTTASGMDASATGTPITSPLLTIVGRLLVTPGTSMPPTATHMLSSTDIPTLQLNLLAPDEDVTVNDVTISGTANPGQNSDITWVKLVVDVNGNGAYDAGTDAPFLGSSQTFSASGTATFTVNRTLTQGGGEDWLVLYDFGAAHSHGDS
ncbi:MAG: hypothetical protein ACYTHM_11775, partial [Planctomycetota bacterium]